MKKILLLVLCLLFFVGCSDRSKKIEKLLISNHISLFSINSIDSIIDYPDSHELFIEALNQDEKYEKELKSVISFFSALSSEERSKERYQTFLQTKKNEFLKTIKYSKELKQKSATKRLENNVDGNTPKFLGWKVATQHGDTLYTYYFDKKISKIRGVERSITSKSN